MQDAFTAVTGLQQPPAAVSAPLDGVFMTQYYVPFISKQ